jgi:hypothetical protein
MFCNILEESTEFLVEENIVRMTITTRIERTRIINTLFDPVGLTFWRRKTALREKIKNSVKITTIPRNPLREPEWGIRKIPPKMIRANSGFQTLSNVKYAPANRGMTRRRYTPSELGSVKSALIWPLLIQNSVFPNGFFDEIFGPQNIDQDYEPYESCEIVQEIEQNPPDRFSGCDIQHIDGEFEDGIHIDGKKIRVAPEGK